MNHRPASIHRYAILFLAFPLLVIAAQYGTTAPAALLLWPLGALAIWSLRPVGWWILLATALGQTLVQAGDLAADPQWPRGLIMATGLGLHAAALVTLHRHLEAPWYRPRRRHWAMTEGHGALVGALLILDQGDHSARLSDLSLGGAWVLSTLESGQRIRFIRLSQGNRVLDLPCQVVRGTVEAPGLQGYGLRFHKLSPVQESELATLIQILEHLAPPSGLPEPDRRRHLRFPLQPTASLEVDGKPHAVDLLDLGPGGATLRSPEPLAAGDRVTLSLGSSEPWSLEARVAWVQADGDRTQAGLIFLRNMAEARRRLQAYLGILAGLRGSPRHPAPRPQEAQALEEVLSAAGGKKGRRS